MICYCSEKLSDNTYHTYIIDTEYGFSYKGYYFYFGKLLKMPFGMTIRDALRILDGKKPKFGAVWIRKNNEDK